MKATISPVALLSALDLHADLNPGDEVLVRFGSRGSQSAVITKRTPQGNLLGRKWRAKSRSYTQPVRIHPGDVIRVLSRA